MASNKSVVIVVAGEDKSGAVLDAVNKHLEEMRNKAEAADSAMGKFGERFTRALEMTGIYFGIREAIRGIEEMVKSSVELGVEIGHLSKQTGISTENLSVLKYAADQTGVSFETFTKGFKKLSESMYEVEHGSKQAVQAFGALGISQADLQKTGGDMYNVLDLVASRMATMPDGFEKNAAATKLFGRAGQDLIPVLDQGSAGIERYRSEAANLGIMLNSQTIENMEELHRSVAQMEGSFEGLALEITSALSPALQRMAKDATELVKALRVSPADALKLMGSNFISNVPMFGPAAAALKARGEQMRKEAMDDINGKVALQSAADSAESSSHFGSGGSPGFMADPEAAKKLKEQRDKAGEVLRQAQGKTADTSGYRDSFKLQEQMQREAGEQADKLSEDYIKEKQVESEAAVKSSKEQIAALREVQEGRIAAASEAYRSAEQATDFEVEQGRISADRRADILRDAAARELEIKQNALAQMAALDSINPDNPEKVQRDLNLIGEVQAEHNEKMVELDRQAAEQRAEAMTGLLHSVFDPFMERPKHISDAFKKMADDILGDLQRIAEQKLIQSIVGGMNGGVNGGGRNGVSGLGDIFRGIIHPGTSQKASNGGYLAGAGTIPDAAVSALQQGHGGASSGSGVVVNMITQGTPQQVQSSGSSGDGQLEKMIVSIVLKDADTLGPMSQGIGGAIKMLGQF